MSTQNDKVDLGVLLNLAFQSFKEQLHRSLMDAGFADVGSSFGYVFRLLSKEPLSLGTIANRLGITSQGALKILSEMEARGYLKRRSHARDRRVVLFELTPKAATAKTRAKQFHAEFEEKLAEQVGNSKARVFRQTLELIANSGNTSIAEARPT